ncbi:single-stranded DNA-binding protein [Candidatus Mycoplasma haematohominis]|uniref:single-stranded DNA-binding protein n=1 Tax=Candidatus Mycoplasma haematohominis TaxID=1494318 RepID=UPI001C0A7135|nr:single-stranded DNA-binding protein [Candidatus Mycoplasma haemohominis]
MLPKGFLVGNVTADPQAGVAQASQNPYSRFSVACNENFFKPNTTPRAHYFNCVVWGKRSQFVQNFIKKGDKVFIEFSLFSNSYINQEGKTVKTIDLIVEKYRECWQ